MGTKSKGATGMNQKERALAQEIRSRYAEKKTEGIAMLTALDRKVTAPANALAIAVGSVAALVMGTGMSLIMTDIGVSIGLSNPMIPGVITGLVGLLTAAANYPLYRKFLAKRRRTYASSVLDLSDRILAEDAERL